MSFKLIIQCQEKLNGASISEVERKFNIPKGTLHNVKNGFCKLPSKHKDKLLSFIFDGEQKQIDKWNKLSAKNICKHKFPKWLTRLRTFCINENITVDELISGYEKFKMVSK